MRSSPTISLFSAQPEQRGQPYSFVFSILAHCVTIGLLFLGIMSAPKVKAPVIAERYAVRHLDLHTLDPKMEHEASNTAKSLLAHSKPGASSSDNGQRVQTAQVVDAPRGAQTLVQPDVHKNLVLDVNIPVPQVVLWNGTKTPVKVLVAPMPEKPPVANVTPSLQLPNDAKELADLGIAALKQFSQTQLLHPTTTSPYIVHGPNPTLTAPVTTTAGSAHPTSGTVMSLSGISMENGIATLPPVNESAASSSRGGGHGNSGEDADGMGNGQGGQFSTTRILRQKEGRFGAVVVGSSLEERYPVTAKLWSGRMAYTVYVPVGLAKSWILQFSLSRDENAAAAGNIMHIEAPWPYSIVRPNIAPGAIDADALMVHGTVNQAGRFENLAVVFPPSFSQTKFVLSTLSQWQFRPAMQNGKNVTVEVLLIIPETYE
jgi:hypothetical protein